ncbi:NADH:flavin oxidoreductase/NADH oxidase [Hoeflea sp.]|uniref:NADH:flavin oxidoreductase/NADH oxidase n=1 Tax=Hoeflea sp. TaxID=1940281 RepID=UPI003B016C2C
MPGLFDTFEVRSVALRNRIGVSPMCQYFAGPDGMPTDWHLVHLGSRAVGGAGLVMSEMTAISPEGRTGPKDVGIWSDEHIAPWRRITDFIRAHGAVPGMQLGHAGRKASTYWDWHPTKAKSPLPESEGGWSTLFAPSALPLRSFDATPVPLSEDQIQALVEAHSDAARRALEAGFEWLEVHTAHGYLHATFLSPFSNKREDDWGGSFDNRCRFTIACIRAIRQVWPDDKPLAVRLSSTEWIDGGWQLEDTIALSERLLKEGVDLIDCSSGVGTAGGDFPRYPIAPGWQVPFAEAVRSKTGALTAAVGQISEPRQADMIIRNGQADMVLLASAMLADPYWPFHASQSLGHHAGDGVTMPAPYGYVIQRNRPYQPEAKRGDRGKD